MDKLEKYQDMANKDPLISKVIDLIKETEDREYFTITENGKPVDKDINKFMNSVLKKVYLELHLYGYTEFLFGNSEDTDDKTT